MNPTLLAIGAVVGLLVGLTAAGGGAILTPWLVLGVGLSAPVAVGTDVVVAGALRLAAGGAFAARKAVDWLTVRRPAPSPASWWAPPASAAALCSWPSWPSASR